VAGDVFREGRIDDQRLPAWVGRNAGIADLIGVLDRCVRPPGVISVLGVPGGDRRIRFGHVELGQKPRSGGKARALLLRGLIRDVIPLAGRRVGPGPILPKICNLCLVGGARRAVRGAQ
jgi:hypothetical protein